MCKRNCRIFFFGRGKCAAWSAAALGPGGPLKKPGRAAVAGPGLLWLIAVLEPSQSMVPQAGQPWLSAVGAAVVVVEFPAMTACAAHHETWTRCTHGIVVGWVWNGDHNVACAGFFWAPLAWPWTCGAWPCFSFPWRHWKVWAGVAWKLQWPGMAAALQKNARTYSGMAWPFTWLRKNKATCLAWPTAMARYSHLAKRSKRMVFFPLGLQGGEPPCSQLWSVSMRQSCGPVMARSWLQMEKKSRNLTCMLPLFAWTWYSHFQLGSGETNQAMA